MQTTLLDCFNVLCDGDGNSQIYKDIVKLYFAHKLVLQGFSSFFRLTKLYYFSECITIIRTKLASTRFDLMCSKFFTWPLHLLTRCTAYSRNWTPTPLYRLEGDMKCWKREEEKRKCAFCETKEFGILRKNDTKEPKFPRNVTNGSLSQSHSHSLSSEKRAGDGEKFSAVAWVDCSRNGGWHRC